MFLVNGLDDWVGDYEALFDLTKTSHHHNPKIIIPNYWYHMTRTVTVKAGPSLVKSGAAKLLLGFVFVDTYVWCNPGSFGESATQQHEDVKKTLRILKDTADYIIVVGDQHVHSSGSSGGSSCLKSTLDPLLRENLVDVYISGRDVTGELLDGGELIYLNVGNFGSVHDAKFKSTTPNSVYFADQPGVTTLSLGTEKLTIEFWSSEARPSFTFSVDKKVKDQ